MYRPIWQVHINKATADGVRKSTTVGADPSEFASLSEHQRVQDLLHRITHAPAMAADRLKAANASAEDPDRLVQNSPLVEQLTALALLAQKVRCARVYVKALQRGVVDELTCLVPGAGFGRCSIYMHRCTI